MGWLTTADPFWLGFGAGVLTVVALLAALIWWAARRPDPRGRSGEDWFV